MSKLILSKLKSVKEFKAGGQTVLVRVDYNVEIVDGKVLDATRLIDSLPTLQYLLNLNSKILIFAHLGRPQGERRAELSLRPVAEKLAEILGRKLVEIVGENAKFPSYPIPHLYFWDADLRSLNPAVLAQGMRGGDLLLFENIRFFHEEENLNENFAEKLASLGDVYVNEAFSVDHHTATSVTLLPKKLPSFAGLRLMDELKTLDYVSTASRKPLVLVIGGAKIAEKEKMLQTLLPRADQLLLGGAMANLFLRALNYEVGDSLVEKEGLHLARELLRNFKEKIILPQDGVVGKEGDSFGAVKDIGRIRRDEKILDIGPQTILRYTQIIKSANTIIWNGPLGLFENKTFANGTLSLARIIASRGRGRAFVLVGGGETLQALDQTKMGDQVDFVSTGGGAMLAYLGGEDLPGLQALT